MENVTRNSRLPALVGALAVVLVAAAIWATVALAGGGSSGSSGSEPNNSPAAAFVQEGEGEAPTEDCPERDGGEDPSDASADV
jgi:hypothetical protein